MIIYQTFSFSKHEPLVLGKDLLSNFKVQMSHRQRMINRTQTGQVGQSRTHTTNHVRSI